MLICCGVRPAFNVWEPLGQSGEWSYMCSKCGRIGWREEFDPMTEAVDGILDLPQPAVGHWWAIRNPGRFVHRRPRPA